MTARGIAGTLDAIARGIGAVGVAVLAATVTWVVFSRYVLGTTPRWSEELPRLILIWVTWFGVVSAFIRGTHFQAGILPFVVRGPWARRAAGIAARLASAAFLVLLAVTGWQITLFTWDHASTALGLPGGLFYAALPVCAAASLIGLIAAEVGS